MGQLFIRNLSKIATFREELSEEPVSVLIRAPLPRRVWVRKIDLNVVNGFQIGVASKLFPSVGCRRFEGVLWILTSHHTESDFHRMSGLVWHFHSHIQACLPFDEGGGTGSALPPTRDNRVEFPMAERRAFTDLFRTLTNRAPNQESTACFRRLLMLALVPEHLHFSGCEAPRVEPSIDRFETHKGLPFRSSLLRDLLRRPRLLQLLVQLLRKLRGVFPNGYARGSSFVRRLLGGLRIIPRTVAASLNFSSDGRRMPT
jgi:hypothetical protein